MEPRDDPRPAARFHAIKPRHVKIVTNLHQRVSGVTWDILSCVAYLDHHDTDLGTWGTADAASLHGPLIVAGGEDERVSIEPRQVLRLAVLQ